MNPLTPAADGRPANEVLSIAEIRARFKSKWVLLEDPYATLPLAVHSGRVLWHAKTRAEVLRKRNDLKPRYFAIVHTGKRTDEEARVIQVGWFPEERGSECGSDSNPAPLIGEAEAPR